MTAGALGPDPHRAVDLRRRRPSTTARPPPSHGERQAGPRRAGGPPGAPDLQERCGHGLARAGAPAPRARGADLTLVTAVRWEEGGSLVAVHRRRRRLRGGGADLRAPSRTSSSTTRSAVVAAARARPGGTSSTCTRSPSAWPWPRCWPAVPAAVAAHPLRGVLGPEHRQAVPAAVPLVRALVPPPGRRGLHLQRRGRRDPPAQGPRRRAGAAPAGGRRRAVPAGGPPASGRHLRVGFVGRLIPHKGVDVLLEAVAGDARMSAEIFGAGPEADRLAGRGRPARRQPTG